MRSFILLGHRAALRPDFTLNDLPGSAGRLDILCRCVTAAFCLSHGIRRDVTVYLVLQNQLVIRLEGTRLKHLNPDERSTGALLQKALRAHQEHPEREIESTPGIFISKGTLSTLLQLVGAIHELPLYLLHEQGRPIRETELPQDIVFILSDHCDFQPDEEAFLKEYPKLSLGPLALHADHCIAITHNELDLRIFIDGGIASRR